VSNGLCPWASTVNRDNRLKITTLKTTTKSALQKMLRTEVEDMMNTETPTESTLVVIPTLFDFEEFLDCVDTAERILWSAGMDADVQIATFHPDYQFHGTEATDLSNYTNRSPYPILHLLKVAQVAEAISRVNGNTAFVWENNIRRLNSMGRDKVKQIHAEIAAAKHDDTP
jgi:hypothetical protein